MKVLSVILLGFLCIAVVSAETWAEARVRHSKGNFVVSENEFEYVVVGAGPGGCATAATLSGQGKKTLLLERGLPRSKNWQTQTILGWPDVVNSEAGEEIRTESGVWTITAKSMGGATALNGGAFLFEKRSFWEKYSNRFDIDEMFHAYDWVKERLPHPLPLGDYGRARLEACDQAGFAQWGFHNYSLDNPLGTQTLWATFYNKDGVLTRNAADVLLDTKNPLLTIRTEAKVTNIEFVDGSTPDKPRASCVQYNWNNKVHVVCPKKEIVMSAGAIWTPFLLQKSGVGPADHLKNYGVRVIKDIPAIGKNLHDKPVVNLVTFYHWNMSKVPFTAIETGCTDPTPFMVEQTSGGNITSSFGIATLALVPPEYRFEALRPIMKLIMGTPGPVKRILNHSSQFLSPLTHPYSRGTLGLKRSTPFSDLSPAIDFNYWSDPRDLTAATYALRKLEEIVNTPAMRPWLYRKEKNTFTEMTDAIATLVEKTPFKNVFNWAACEVLPEGQVVTLPCTPDLTSDEAIKTWLMTYHASSYHIAGTMEMGVVLDRDFRVIGIENLRVADASVLPQITEVNPQGTIEMIGRYAGLRILGLKAKDLAAAHAHDEL